MELKLKARDGMVLTNGETYGKSLSLGVNDSKENWWEITEEEYLEIQRSSESEFDVE